MLRQIDLAGTPTSKLGMAVMLSSLALWIRSRWAIEELGVCESSIYCQRISIGFVDLLSEIFPVLCAGGTVAVYGQRHSSEEICSKRWFSQDASEDVDNTDLPDEGDALAAANPAEFWNFVEQAKVTHITLVPALLRLYTDYLESLASVTVSAVVRSLRAVVSSGEPLTWVCANRFIECITSHSCTELDGSKYSQSSRVALYNLYGSTETTGDCLFYKVTRPEVTPTGVTLVPLGKPLLPSIDVTAVVTARSGGVETPMLKGGGTSTTVGELLICGPVVASGYYQGKKGSLARNTGPNVVDETAHNPEAGVMDAAHSLQKDDHVDTQRSEFVILGEAAKGWLSGDLAWADENGDWNFIARVGLEFKLHGVTVYPQDVEHLVAGLLFYEPDVVRGRVGRAEEVYICSRRRDLVGSQEYMGEKLKPQKPSDKPSEEAEGCVRKRQVDDALVVFICLEASIRQRIKETEVEEQVLRAIYGQVCQPIPGTGAASNELRQVANRKRRGLFGDLRLPCEVVVLEQLPRSLPTLKVCKRTLARLYGRRRQATHPSRTNTVEVNPMTLGPQDVSMKTVLELCQEVLDTNAVKVDDDMIGRWGMDSITIGRLAVKLGRVYHTFVSTGWLMGLYHTSGRLTVSMVLQLLKTLPAKPMTLPTANRRATPERMSVTEELEQPVVKRACVSRRAGENIDWIGICDTAGGKAAVDDLLSGGVTQAASTGRTPAYMSSGLSGPVPCVLIWRLFADKCVDSCPLVVRPIDGMTAIKDDLVFISSHASRLDCILAISGISVWSRPLPGRVLGRPCAYWALASQRGCFEAVGVDMLNQMEHNKTPRKDVYLSLFILVATQGGTVICVDGENGMLRWTVDIRGSSVKATPMVVSARSFLESLRTLPKQAIGVDDVKGVEANDACQTGRGGSCAGWICVGDHRGVVYLFDAITGTLRATMEESICPSRTGSKETESRRELRGVSGYVCVPEKPTRQTPCVTMRIIVTYLSGHVVAYDIVKVEMKPSKHGNPASMETHQAWKVSLQSPVFGEPVVANITVERAVTEQSLPGKTSKVVFASSLRGEVVCLDVSQGRKLWCTQLHGPLCTTDAVLKRNQSTQVAKSTSSLRTGTSTSGSSPAALDNSFGEMGEAERGIAVEIVAPVVGVLLISKVRLGRCREDGACHMVECIGVISQSGYTFLIEANTGLLMRRHDIGYRVSPGTVNKTSTQTDMDDYGREFNSTADEGSGDTRDQPAGDSCLLGLDGRGNCIVNLVSGEVTPLRVQNVSSSAENAPLCRGECFGGVEAITTSKNNIVFTDLVFGSRDNFVYRVHLAKHETH
eukprot:GHVS01008975.1.p1 GENE.GHVS01008975.1~~GHVS01008975.1.p1  ORF type:complete len:1551 (+),score=157.48 GHVS01008975.1:698-4654(+)